MIPRQLQVEHRTGKVRRSKTNVLPMYHATNPKVSFTFRKYHWICNSCYCHASLSSSHWFYLVSAFKCESVFTQQTYMTNVTQSDSCLHRHQALSTSIHDKCHTKWFMFAQTSSAQHQHTWQTSHKVIHVCTDIKYSAPAYMTNVTQSDSCLHRHQALSTSIHDKRHTKWFMFAQTSSAQHQHTWQTSHKVIHVCTDIKCSAPAYMTNVTQSDSCLHRHQVLSTSCHQWLEMGRVLELLHAKRVKLSNFLLPELTLHNNLKSELYIYASSALV